MQDNDDACISVRNGAFLLEEYLVITLFLELPTGSNMADPIQFFSPITLSSPISPQLAKGERLPSTFGKWVVQ